MTKNKLKRGDRVAFKYWNDGRIYVGIVCYNHLFNSDNLYMINCTDNINRTCNSSELVPLTEEVEVLYG